MSATGFGVCGHKNSYNTRVKCGNWIEDRAGIELKAGLIPQPHLPVPSSTVRSDFIDPRCVVDTRPAVDQNLPSVLEVKDKNRNGTPVELLFGHMESAGRTARQDANERFMTVSRTAFQNSFPSYSPCLVPGEVSPQTEPPREKMQARQAKIARERLACTSFATTNQLMSQRAQAKVDHQRMNRQLSLQTNQ